MLFDLELIEFILLQISDYMLRKASNNP